MNNGSFETPVHWNLTRSNVPNTGIINCWNNRRTALTRYLQGEIMVWSEYASRFLPSESFVRSVQQVEDDDAFCRLIYRFTVNKMMAEISIRAKTRTNERHDETSESVAKL